MAGVAVPNPLRIDRQPRDPDNQPPVLPNWTILMNGFHVFCSVPILSVPYAMKVGGWRSIVALVFFCVASFFSAYLMNLCLRNHDQPMRTYPEVARAAFGKPGFYLVQGIVFFYNYASCVEPVIIAMDMLSYMLEKRIFTVVHHGITVGVLITYITVIVLFFVVAYHDFPIFDLYLTATGVILTPVLVFALIAHGIVNIQHLQLKSTKYFNFSTFRTAIGFYAYCFAGHLYLPELYHSMGDTSEFSKIMLMIFFPSSVFYLVVGTFGYAIFGENVKSIFVLSMPKTEAPTIFAIISVLLHQVIRYILALGSTSRDFDDFVKLYNGGEVNRNIGYAGRAVLVGTTIVFSQIIPVYGPLMSFVGSAFGIVVALVIPCVCFLRLRWGDVTRLQGVFTGLVIVIALAAAGLGISQSLPELFKGVED